MYVTKLFEARAAISMVIMTILLTDITIFCIPHILVVVALFCGTGGHILALLHFYFTMGYKNQAPRIVSLTLGNLANRATLEDLRLFILLQLAVCLKFIFQRLDFHGRADNFHCEISYCPVL
jgi:hypothetical protein